ncbi:MAG: class I SAM-dependent methyltransferase [Clostridiaceae bacterium]|nr:class I SAM-dependent methyltransferase [Clostridiaceae bacterium]
MDNEKLAKSLSANDTNIIPYLPCLLQDLWELGCSVGDVIYLIKNNMKEKNLKALDLACGKGAASVALAKEFGFFVKGVDLMPEFIDFAKSKAEEFGVLDLCEFEAGDVCEKILAEKGYDLVLFLASGEILGDWEKSLFLLKNTVKEGGFIIIDDAYANCGDYLTWDDWLGIFDKCGVCLVEKMTAPINEVKRMNEINQSFIVKRAEELKIKYPHLSDLFDDYIKCQEEEIKALESNLTPFCALLKAL